MTEKRLLKGCPRPDQDGSAIFCANRECIAMVAATGSNQEEAAAAWNTRTNEPQPNPQIKQLLPSQVSPC